MLAPSSSRLETPFWIQISSIRSSSFSPVLSVHSAANVSISSPVSVTKTLHLTTACTEIVQLLESNNRKGNMSFPSRGVVIFGMIWDEEEQMWRAKRADIEFDSISLHLGMGGMVRFGDGRVVEGGKEQTQK